MDYSIEFRNTADGTNNTVTNITGNFYCTNEYDSAASVVVWATYKGTEGIKSNETFFTTTQKPTPPPATTASAITTQGIKLFVHHFLYNFFYIDNSGKFVYMAHLLRLSPFGLSVERERL